MPNVPDFKNMEINDKLISLDRSIYDKLENDLFTMIPKLDKQNWYAPIAYTPHDYTHHVKRVLQYASHLLKNVLNDDVFSKEDLQVLQYACILHDIDMIYNPEDREKHSANARIIMNPYSEKETADETEKIVVELLEKAQKEISSISAIQNIKTNEEKEATSKVHDYLIKAIKFLIPNEELRDAIGQVIIGHSDIKKGTLKIDTLKQEFYSEVVVDDKYIKTRVLAAILRLADELDCSKQRRQGIEEDEIELIIGQEPAARKYWDRLNLISTIDFDMPDIRIKVNSSYIGRHSNRYICFEWLKEVYDKIIEEYNVVVKVIREDIVRLDINKPILEFGNDQIEKEYEDFCDRKNKENEKKNNLSKEIDLIKLRNHIQTTIKEKNLFYEVHRLYEHEGDTPDRGMRNYLDCNGLLTDQELLDDISCAFVNYIYTESFEQSPQEFSKNDCFLVGVANSGVLIASRMELITGIPAMYYVPAEKEGSISEQEIDWRAYSKYYKNKKAILVLGVNVTGRAINGVQAFLKKNIESNEDIPIEAVVGIVNRDIYDKNRIINALKNQGTKIGFILKGYQVDWCNYSDKKTKCPYDDQCGIVRK